MSTWYEDEIKHLNSELNRVREHRNELVERNYQARKNAPTITSEQAWRALLAEVDNELTHARTVGSNSSGYKLGLLAARRIIITNARAAGVEMDADA